MLNALETEQRDSASQSVELTKPELRLGSLRTVSRGLKELLPTGPRCSSEFHSVRVEGSLSTVLSSSQAKLAAVAVASEVEVEVQDAALERTLEAALVRHLPLLVHDLERDVLRSLRCGKTSPTVTPLPANVPPQYPIPTYRFQWTDSEKG